MKPGFSLVYLPSLHTTWESLLCSFVCIRCSRNHIGRIDSVRRQLTRDETQADLQRTEQQLNNSRLLNGLGTENHHSGHLPIFSQHLTCHLNEQTNKQTDKQTNSQCHAGPGIDRLDNPGVPSPAGLQRPV